MPSQITAAWGSPGVQSTSTMASARPPIAATSLRFTITAE